MVRGRQAVATRLSVPPRLAGHPHDAPPASPDQGKRTAVDHAGLWLWLALLEDDRVCVLGAMVEV
jgi:hypothetical protein